jgi:SAM-dependent methyltransferase
MEQDELEAMLAADERHWWYRGRRRVLRAELDRLAMPRPWRILDAGCGSGRTMEELASYGEVSGVDLSLTAVAAAGERGFDDVRQGSLDALPWADASFDLVACLDVVEHVADDRRALAELRRVVPRGGFLVVTVPAYPALWSHHDVVNRHYRRYRSDSLREAAVGAGWRLVHDTHFNSALLAPAAAVRLTRRRRGARSELELTPPSLDGLLEVPLRVEAGLLSRGVRLPVGLSLLAVFENAAA